MTVDQPSLPWDRPPVDRAAPGKYQQQGQSSSSRIAAERVRPRSGTQRAKVLHLLMYEGPMTDEEMQERLVMSANTQRPRRVELVQQGWVRDSGLRRPTSTGQDAVVWTFIPERGD